ncbi:MAG: xylulokinase [Anaerolineales bacterium]|uniref:xylulokinase n=1 Tax=Candidatus Hadarchaeum sp. TaxID=2883567 RepID=UPI003CB08AE8
MKKEFILAHDLGTTGNKAVLVHCENGVQETFFAPYSTYYPYPTWAEQDPEEWWNAIIVSTRGVLARANISPNDIACIVFSGQMMGCVPVDHLGTPLGRAIIWADQRAILEYESLLKKLDLQEIYYITGHRVGPAYSALKIMWIKRHIPRVFRQTFKFLQAKDFIICRLTGKYITDYSDACGTGLLDIRTKQWDERMLKATEIPETVLPEIYPSCAVVGEVTKEASAKLGLPTGLPVVAGGGDGVCATAGAGVIQPGIGHIYLGSSAWVAGASVEPILDPKMRTFTWPHLDPNLYSPNGTMHNAGSSLEWAKEAFGTLEINVAEWLGLTPYDLIEREAETIPPGCEGLIFLPYLMGERSPYWDPSARGVFLGITKKHKRAHFLRAVYEGVALNLRTIFLALRELGVDFHEMRAIGGGVKSRLWAKIIADALGTTLHVTDLALEATALGAAMAGAVGVELISDFVKAAQSFVKVKEIIEPGPAIKTYAQLHKIFLETYEALRGIFQRLSSLEKGGGG